MNLFSELKRRNIFKVAIAYLMLSWLILQLVDVISPLLVLPEWLGGFILILLVVLFPITLIITWAFELTPEGMKRKAEVDEDQSIRYSTGQKIYYIIIGFLILVVGFQFWSGNEAPAPQEIVIDAPAPESAITEDAIPVNSIAVLPFINMSSDPEQEYFSDGISEEILNVLAQIKDLKVTSRTSSFQFKDTEQDLPAVATQLGVSKILEGSVRKSGTRIRITAQLIEAETDVHLWSETYDRDLSDIFAVQDEISKAIVDALKTTLNIDASNVNFAQGTANTEAHEEYMLGNYLFNTVEAENFALAKIHYERATTLDPAFAEAWAMLSITHIVLSDNEEGQTPVREAMQQQKIMIDKALSINPDLVEVQFALGVYYDVSNDQLKAIDHYKRAIEINPNFANAYRLIAYTLEQINQPVEAIKYIELAAKTDPMSLLVNMSLAVHYVSFEQFEKVQKSADRMMQINKNSLGSIDWQSLLLAAQGQYPEAIRNFRELSGRSEERIPLHIARSLVTIGIYDGIIDNVPGVRDDIWAFYLDQNYDEFIKMTRASKTLVITAPSERIALPLAELLAENYSLANEIYQSHGVCDEPISYLNCQNLVHVKMMLGDGENAANYLEKLKKLEFRANEEGWRLANWYPNEISEAYTLVMAGEIDQALAIYKEQLSQGFFHYEIMAPHFKELHDHPDWPAFLEDIKTFQAGQQAKLAELEAGD